MRIVFAGSGAFGLPSLRALLNSTHRIEQIVTQPDRPAGRGRQLAATPIGHLAAEAGLPLLRTTDINAEPLPEAGLLVVIAFGQKIAPATIGRFSHAAINLHASRLPQFRGAGPVNAAILAGQTVTGNSVIRLAERMDAGTILGQSQLSIGALETAGELHDRLADDGGPLLLGVIDALEAGRAVETPQDHTLATKAPKLSRATARIDWTRSAAEIARQIRGLFPWPGCQVELLDAADRAIAAVTLCRARPLASAGTPGVINADGTVGCGVGSVEIVEVQPLGKRPMSLAAFRNGRPWTGGMRLRARPAA